MVAPDGGSGNVVVTGGDDVIGQMTIASDPEPAVLVINEEVGTININVECAVEEVPTQEPDESDIVSFPDTVMSIGDSSSEGSPCNSTCGSSASATGSRKRAAEGSPEREVDATVRRDFPGRITRSAGGCRVYVPPIVDDGTECPMRVLNDDGSIRRTETVGQGGGFTVAGEGGCVADNYAFREVVGSRVSRDNESPHPEPSIQAASGPSESPENVKDRGPESTEVVRPLSTKTTMHKSDDDSRYAKWASLR